MRHKKQSNPAPRLGPLNVKLSQQSTIPKVTNHIKPIDLPVSIPPSWHGVASMALCGKCYTSPRAACGNGQPSQSPTRESEKWSTENRWPGKKWLENWPGFISIGHLSGDVSSIGKSNNIPTTNYLPPYRAMPMALLALAGVDPAACGWSSSWWFMKGVAAVAGIGRGMVYSHVCLAVSCQSEKGVCRQRAWKVVWMRLVGFEPVT